LEEREKEAIWLNWKNYLMALCLSGVILALAFTQISSSQTTKQYDPWLDYNDDGRIDMRDVVATVLAFGTKGDPTKPVIINHNWREGNYSFYLKASEVVSFSITTAGFRVVAIRILAYSDDGHNYMLLISQKITGKVCEEPIFEEVVPSQETFKVGKPTILLIPLPHFKKIYEVTFSELAVRIHNN